MSNNFITPKKIGRGAILLFTLIALVFSFSYFNNPSTIALEKEQRSLEQKIENRKARKDYFINMLRDPKTNKIPESYRLKELDFARDIDQKYKSSGSTLLNWQEAGPNVVGGRTRAVVLDISDPTGNTVLAGAASGGVWKSTDGGNSWVMKSDPNKNLSVTTIAQDPINTNIWYYGAGEFDNNTASGRLSAATYYGTGVWRSIDSGETWVNVTADMHGVGDDSWNSPYDYISKIMVSARNSHVFIATNGFGFFRSNNGTTFTNIFSTDNEHRYLDFDIDSQGNILLVASENSATSGALTTMPGIYYSSDNGTTWADKTPSIFTANHSRSIVEFAPSSENLAYIFTHTGQKKASVAEPSETVEKLSLIKMDVLSGRAVDLSANIPEFDSYRGTAQTQGDYNMALAVSPTDTNLVILGGVSLFRSTDGFSKALNSSDWIGGYNTDNHHPDNHALFFDPNNPNTLWSAHDGGVSVTNNISSTPSNTTVEWLAKNNGYNVTQFFTIAISRKNGDTRIVGGTQDNGSPYFRLNDANEVINDISTGDGSFAYIGAEYMYVSSQEGHLLRVGYYQNTGEPLNPYGNKYQEHDWSYIYPSEATNKLFIHPFAVDPSNENTIIYPDGNALWRTTAAGSIDDWLEDGDDTYWTKLNFSAGAGYTITALSFTENAPKSRLYFAASSNSLSPRIYYLDNGGTTPTNISIPGADAGVQVNDIAINPLNGNELIVIIANYNTVGTYYSNNAGATWTAIEGNLMGDENNLGPSIRSAEIIEGLNKTVYVLGTSTGVYSTTTLDGNNTIWTKESPDVIGSAVAGAMDYRSSDHTLIVGTHGRGAFIATAGSIVANEEGTRISERPNSFELAQNYPNPFNPSTNIQFNLPNSAKVSINVFDINGRKISTLLNNSSRSAGQHNVTFDAGNLATGVYLYRINAISESGKSFVQSKKMTLIK
ncbi:MAG: T9SS type A sorting domain-containing protein [Balneolaceae bacterium]